MTAISDNVFTDLALGFHLRSVDLGSFSAETLLSSSRDWEVLAGVNLACRSGDFAKLDYVPVVMQRNEGALIWSASVKLIGFAGDWRRAITLFQAFQEHIDEPGVRYYLALLFVMTRDQRAISALTALYRDSRDEEATEQIIRELSLLLEFEGGPLFDLIYDPPSHRELMAAVHTFNAPNPASRASPLIFEGEELDVVALVRRLLARLGHENVERERISREALVFGAMTGVDCTTMFDQDRRLDRLEAVGILEAFLEGDTSKFIPGQRFFFGHPIPA